MLRARLKVVGIALSSVVNFMNPEMVVLGGGLVDEMPKLVLKTIEEGMREYLVPEVSDAVRIRRTQLGSSAVVLGAAWEAMQEHHGEATGKS
jgi:glucokinase